MKVVLASNSPRRKELLKYLVDDFVVQASNIDESYPENMDVKKIPEYLAIKKANDVYLRNKDCIIIAADTIVLYNDIVLTKPKSKQDIVKMMKMLSNNTHKVITGVCVIKNDKKKSFSCVSKVTFNKMSDEEIDNYSNLKTVYDKAGAYAIQEDAAKFIKKINGDYYNVVGLPISKLYSVLKEL